MGSTRGFGLKNINFGVFSLGQEVPKTIFLLRRPRLPHNFGLRLIMDSVPKNWSLFIFLKRESEGVSSI
jgi:hypothetical protein